MKKYEVVVYLQNEMIVEANSKEEALEIYKTKFPKKGHILKNKCIVREIRENKQ